MSSKLNCFFVFCFFLIKSSVSGQTLNSNVPDSPYSKLNQNEVDTLLTLNTPLFFSDSHLLFGAEILDPLKPKDFFTRATRLWKTDIRIGIKQQIGNKMKAVFSIRDEDSPQTNSIKLYETYASVDNNWGKIIIGQRRIKAGGDSYYINQAFDRTFWDKGLIYDFVMRGLETSIAFNNSALNLFVGSELSAGFIGGGKYYVQPFDWLSNTLSALYIARDPKYAAFGFQFGLESSESFETFNSYQVIGYKTFDQEPSRIKELTLFNEMRYSLNSKFELGGAVLFRRLILKPYQDEFRASIDVNYHHNEFFTPSLQIEKFKILDYSETQIGIAGELNYYNYIKVIPRLRYIITDYGPNIGFIGIEGQIKFGSSD